MRQVGVGCVLAVVWALSLGAAAAETKPGPSDPWEGKLGADAITLLGEPDKRKKSSDGGEVWVYKLLRVGPDFDPSTPARLIDLPGVGLVARKDKGQSGAVPELSPSTVDESGRPGSGVPWETRSASASYDPKTGKTERSGFDGPPGAPVGGGKFRLTLELDAADRVTGWSVSSKK